jgi:hypothetical protein
MLLSFHITGETFLRQRFLEEDVEVQGVSRLRE